MTLPLKMPAQKVQNSHPLIDPAAAALLEAVRRASRGGAPRSVLVLHLAGAEGVQPHHARVARAILTDIAQKLEGEVLRLIDGDLALICRRRPGAPDLVGPDGEGPESLPAVLERLFAIATPQTGRLFSCWRLPEEGAALQAVLERPAAPAAAPRLITPRPDPLTTVSGLLEGATPMLIRKQTAMRLDLAGGGRLLRPCFEEVTVTIEPGADGRNAGHEVQTDPFVFRHLAARLDQRALSVLTAELAGSPTHPGPSVALHVNLALPCVLTSGFTDLAAMCAQRGRRLGVELSLIEACGDPTRFTAARARLEAVGASLVLDGVTAEALALTRPGALGAARVKLEWNPTLSRLAGLARGRLVESLRTIGAAHLVLYRAETEAALAFGLAHGITVFQGRHVDAMLAAGRLSICAHASGCTLRQCMDRGAAVDGAGRAGCRDHALLDGSAARDLVLGA